MKVSARQGYERLSYENLGLSSKQYKSLVTRFSPLVFSQGNIRISVSYDYFYVESQTMLTLKAENQDKNWGESCQKMKGHSNHFCVEY